MESYNPGKSNDPDIVKAYLISIGLTEEEAMSLVPNWIRTVPQSMDEVRQGILDERSARESLSNRWANKLNSGNP